MYRKKKIGNSCSIERARDQVSGSFIFGQTLSVIPVSYIINPLGLKSDVLAVLLTAIIGSDSERGAEKMDNSKSKLVVNAPEGTDLRREPTRNYKTEDGRDNLILSLPLGTYVTLASDEMRTNDGLDWGPVKPEMGIEGETGWVDVNDLMGLSKFVVTGPQGTELRREPTMNSKTEDGRENIMFSLPLGTRLILVSNDMSENDGHGWFMCKRETGNGEVGWVDQDLVGEQERLVVTTLQGTELRREPTMNSKTVDGKDNIVLSLPAGVYLIPVSQYTRGSDGHEWGLFSPEIGKEDEMGWVIIDDIGPDGPLFEAPFTTAHIFTFGGKNYEIFEDKLFAAIGQFIFKTFLPGSQEVRINNISYFTTQDKINAMKSPSLAWIAEI